MTLRACRVCGGWHRLEEPWPAECAGHFRSRHEHRSEFAAPMIIRDDMPAVKSMASGKMYDSKSAIRAEYRARGLIEIGSDIPEVKQPERPKITKDDIGAAIQKVRDGYRPAELPTAPMPAMDGWN